MRGLFVPVVMILLSASAAQAQSGKIALPRFFNPPPPRAQVADAQIWDPYPLPEVGGPADSTRPRDFFYPPPEATRGRVWQGAPGTFPRNAPWLRSQAPVDYPNIRKRLSARRTAPAVETVTEDGPAMPPAADNKAAEKQDDELNIYEQAEEKIPAPRGK